MEPLILPNLNCLALRSISGPQGVILTGKKERRKTCKQHESKPKLKLREEV